MTTQQEAQKKLIQYIAILRRGGQQEQEQVRQLASQDQIAAQAVQISDAADQNNPQATQIVAQVEQMIDSQNNSNQMYYAKNGAKLNYLRQLSGNCPEGYEVTYLANGGKGFIKKCKKCEEGKKMNVIEEFKCGGKKKIKKGEQGLNGIPFKRKKTDDFNYTDTKTDAKGRKSQRMVTEDGTLYVGRNGKSGMEGSNIGDSIKRVDWRKGEMLKSRKNK